MASKISFLAFAISVLHITGTNGQNSCTTPRGARGTCIVLQNCAPLYALIQRRPVSTENAEFLRRSQCGFSGRQPTVCCPSGGGSGGGGGQNRGTGPGFNYLPRKNACGTSVTERIYQGENTDKDEFPWMALLGYQKPTGVGYHCGGVLINDRYVMTAAHCVNGRDIPRTWRLTTVRLGEWNTRSEPDCDEAGCNLPVVNVNIESSKVHEDYDPNSVDQANDIALLRLNQAVDYTDNVRPICLPHLDNDVRNLDLNEIDMIVAGWGRTENRASSDILQKLKVPFTASNTCSNRYSATGVQVGAGQLCAGGEQGKDSCRGDSGGPLMINYASTGEANWYLVGIVSFGPTPCGMQGWPGVYTRVTSYLNWVSWNVQP